MLRLVLALGLLATPVAAEVLPAHALAHLADQDIVILGEVHDNPRHHLGQAEALTTLRPKAVVFEMLSPAQAETLNAMARGSAARMAEALDWEGSGWPDFAIYAPVFLALGDTPVAGAALPRAQVRAAFEQGAAAIFGEEAQRFGLDRSLPEAQQTTREQLQFDAHCAAMPREMMGGMVEAQRLRDAHFARVALAALETHGAPIAVIVGNGHARRDWGMPAKIAMAAPSVRVFALGFVEAAGSADDPRFDLTVPTKPAVRRNPCDGFRNAD